MFLGPIEMTGNSSSENTAQLKMVPTDMIDLENCGSSSLDKIDGE